MADKSPQAFRTIREVADWLEVEAHVLRFWESKFSQIKPVKRAGGRRYYRPSDMRLIGGIKVLLHDQGLTIRGAQKIMREDGVAHVAALSQPLDEELQAADDANPVVEATALPAASDAAPAPAGFVDIEALAGDTPQAEATPPEDTAPPMEPAPLPVVADVTESAPPTQDEPPVPDMAVPSEGVAVTPLSELRALIHAAVPLSPAQQQQMAPVLARLEALSTRLGGPGPSA